MPFTPNRPKPPLLVMAIWRSCFFLLEFLFLAVSTCWQAPQPVPSSVILPSSAAALTSLLLLMSLLDFDIILAALTFMADGTLSFTSSLLTGLLHEAELLAETSCRLLIWMRWDAHNLLPTGRPYCSVNDFLWERLRFRTFLISLISSSKIFLQILV